MSDRDDVAFCIVSFAVVIAEDTGSRFNSDVETTARTAPAAKPTPNKVDLLI